MELHGIRRSKGTALGSRRWTWELIAAVDVPAGWEKQQKELQKKQKRLPVPKRSDYVPPMRFTANTGYIVFEDRNTVVFYMNSLS
ncbi:hypothetical protein GN958_ATG07602 [Phytophthora infestans]|uniref:Uncharacterized protein n=1 Tax=Phytophthora infestans TaxID=4787 RepID=A0A8S9UR35_PHYIN|nr:hypothetical protein GN958_ATG07602 [Phytophthora infestans]